MKTFFSLLWYATLIVGVTRIYAKAVAARHAAVPLEKARHAAAALFYCGFVLWASAVLEDARGEFRDLASLFSILEWIDFAGSSIWFSVVILLPTWLPRRLMSGDAGPSRCGFAALVARGVAVFAGFAIIVAPMMFLFALASSVLEFIEAILTVAIPMVILIYVALMTGKLADRAGDTLL